MLALLAGFGAAPVQARIAAPDTAGVERVEGASGIAAVAYAAAEVRARTGTERSDRAPPKPKPPVTTIVLIPSIQFGDRARE
ncbi:hypothetical protein [Novosphingobium sp. Gsoil 351]|uniref:hypothetical protein n=1 Tax=Novosphingobium sp. Gsoil 351 TaxID=2675225 RepID=UPI0018A849FE|nr:hypothetical protein [Novosphingobium sp. Gsoil 351]